MLDDVGMMQSRENFVRDWRKAGRSPAPASAGSPLCYGFKAFKIEICLCRYCSPQKTVKPTVKGNTNTFLDSWQSAYGCRHVPCIPAFNVKISRILYTSLKRMSAPHRLFLDHGQGHQITNLIVLLCCLINMIE